MEDHSRSEPRASLLLELLSRKFGALDSAVVTRIQRASAAEIERWTQHVLNALTLDEVLR